MPRKKDKYVGPDPDPTDYLYVSLESKRLSSERPYDAKKACWVPCAKDGFAVGEIREVKGDQITVFASNKVRYMSSIIHSTSENNNIVNDRAGKYRGRPNRAGSANLTEGSAGGSAEPLLVKIRPKLA